MWASVLCASVCGLLFSVPVKCASMLGLQFCVPQCEGFSFVCFDVGASVLCA